MVRFKIGDIVFCACGSCSPEDKGRITSIRSRNRYGVKWIRYQLIEILDENTLKLIKSHRHPHTNVFK